MLRKILLSSALIVALTGCSITDEIPSFWDDNESAKAVDLFMSVSAIDCKSPMVKAQISRVGNEAQWLHHYARLKGSNDVVSLVTKFETTLVGIASKDVINVNYCRVKRDTLLKQSERIAQGLLGRY
jgi:hypothetical protein